MLDHLYVKCPWGEYCVADGALEAAQQTLSMYQDSALTFKSLALARKQEKV